MKLIDRVDQATRFPMWIACWLIGVALDEYKIRKVNRSICGR